MNALASRARLLLASRHRIWVLPALCTLLFLPGLDAGLLLDDHWHRAALTHDPAFPLLHRPPSQIFDFVGRRTDASTLIREGLIPWWSDPELRLSFWRPLAGLTHGLDYRLWPERPFLMHVHSLLWYVALVVAVLVFFRRMLPSAAAAGLAALIFSVDDGLAAPVLWIANRNALIGTGFGVLALIFYDRWRRDGWRPGSVLAPAALLAAVLGNEGSVAIGGYMVAYALFLDPSSPGRRVLALIPSAAVGIAWALTYRALGYGAAHSTLYVDPGSTEFLGAAGERLPILMWGLWGWPPSDAHGFMSDAGRTWLWALALAGSAGVAAAIWPLLRRRREARFFALGMLGALLPAAASFPSNRLLLFAAIGAAPLITMLVSGLIRRAGGGGRRIVRGGAWVAVAVIAVVHIVIPSVSIPATFDSFSGLGPMLEVAASVPADEGIASQSLVVVHTPSAFISSVAAVARARTGLPLPRETLVLSSGIHGATVRRPDSTSLVLELPGGFLLPSGESPSGQTPALVDLDRLFLTLDVLFRDVDARPFVPGQSTRVSGFTVRPVAVSGGRPMSLLFRFDEALESSRWRWIVWLGGRYEPFELPAVGQEVTIQ